VIDDIAAQIEGSEAIFAIDYRGISVPQAAALRSNLSDADASFRIVKNRLTKLAADKAGRDELKELLEGPTALTFVHGDTAMAAKAITTFNREHNVLSFKGGYMEGLALDEEKFTSIARLPSRDVLNGQLAGVVASPLTGLVRGLGSMVSGLAIALQQIAEQGLVSGESPDSDAPAAGPVAEEDSSSSQAAGEEPTPAPPAEAPAEEATAEAPEEPAADAEAPEEPAADAESSEEPAADAQAPEEPAADAETSDKPETSNEEE